MHQQEKYQHPIFSVDAPGTVIVTNRPQVQPTAQKSSLFFGSGLILLVGLGGGLAIGNYFSERRVANAESALKLEQLQRQATERRVANTESALKLEQLQRQATERQIQEFCRGSLGGNYGR